MVSETSLFQNFTELFLMSEYNSVMFLDKCWPFSINCSLTQQLTLIAYKVRLICISYLFIDKLDFDLLSHCYLLIRQ